MSVDPTRSDNDKDTDKSTETETETEMDAYESFDWILSADCQLLDHFDEYGPGLCPQAAGMLGLHVSFAQRRCEMLCEHGLLYENETEYRLTDRGQQYLEMYS